MKSKHSFASVLLLGLLSSGPVLLDNYVTPALITQNAPAHEMSMDLGPKDSEFDLRFIDGMILHHQGALAMAEAVLQNSQREEMKQLAIAIIAAQEQEIAQMQQWRQQWYPNAGPEALMYHAQMGHSMPMSSEMKASMMMSEDLGNADAEFDLRFLNAMIPHHEGALIMAEQAITNSDRPELQQLAEDILTSQQQEINQMTQWRQQWYGK
ncbi:DUF305 domain-containing protein [Gloeocapsa sp. PCC 73106]|uniref:DUF305 domain-containing protein n=1 Tax=Gloeocapsa sp. PCC 73106 TaxID=102232 RepID=UPI0002ACEB23|nr:DUF305 domain-containing protein [Gloeocapsa sp. PCC 73106]ELR97718.1 hypothetical protein GLO73106DRAFT_00015320 [Gloeocapsa sp. PCC 73106]